MNRTELVDINDVTVSDKLPKKRAHKGIHTSNKEPVSIQVRRYCRYGVFCKSG